MGRIIHRRSEFSAPEIGLLAGGPLAADPAFRSLALNPRAKALTLKYEEEFGDEYRELHKKHLIPFIW